MKNCFTILLVFALFLVSCTKDVPGVTIFVNMNGFEEVTEADDFKEKLEKKLKKHGFKVLSHDGATYSLVVYGFYNIEYTIEVEAEYDDCDNYYYTLYGYEYGLVVDLEQGANYAVNVSEASRVKEDELALVETFDDCSVYEIREPLLLDGYFFKQKAIDIAKKTASIVATR